MDQLNEFDQEDDYLRNNYSPVIGPIKSKVSKRSSMELGKNVMRLGDKIKQLDSKKIDQRLSAHNKDFLMKSYAANSIYPSRPTKSAVSRSHSQFRNAKTSNDVGSPGGSYFRVTAPC